jgi:hypothetical protein
VIDVLDGEVELMLVPVVDAAIPHCLAVDATGA